MCVESGESGWAGRRSILILILMREHVFYLMLQREQQSSENAPEAAIDVD